MSIDLPTDFDADGQPIPRPFARFVWKWTSCCEGCDAHQHWCGCGDPGAVYLFIRDALIALPWYESGFWDAYHPGVAAILAEKLETLGLVEHGTSFRGSWATDDGIEYIRLVGKMTDDELRAEVRHAESCDLDHTVMSGGKDVDCPNCARWGKKA